MKKNKLYLIVIAVIICLLPSCVSKKKYPYALKKRYSRYLQLEEDKPTFKLPPPKPSASCEIDLADFDLNLPATYKELDKKISDVLDDAEYNKASYLYVPNGFAIVTQLERITSDAEPFPEEQRWIFEEVNTAKPFSLSDYIKAIFSASPGYYRTIVFVLTDKEFSVSDEEVPKDVVDNWVTKGLNKLPKSIRDNELTSDHTLTALIYEFKKPESETKAYLSDPSKYRAKTHLKKASILKE